MTIALSSNLIILDLIALRHYRYVMKSIMFHIMAKRINSDQNMRTKLFIVVGLISWETKLETNENPDFLPIIGVSKKYFYS